MKRERIGLVLGLALLVGIAVVPIPGIPDEARRMLAVAAIMATWWVTEAAPLAVTSLLPLVLLPSFGITSAAGAAAPYANNLVYLFLGGFMIAQAMQRWNLHRRIALRTVMAMGSSPPRLVLGFMVASALLSMWVSNTATTAMMMPIGVAVIAEISRAVHGPKRPAPGDFPFAVCLMLGCAYGASIGGFSTLIGTPPNVFLAGFLSEQLDIQISFVRWLAFAMPLTVLFLPLTWLWLTRVAFPIRIKDIPGGREPVRAAYRALGPLSTPEKRLSMLFGVTALAWMFRPVWTGFLPTGGLITDSTIAMGATVLAFLVPAGNGSGERILNWEWGVKIPWDVLILIGGGFSLANGLEVSGLSQFLGDRLAGASALPLPLFVIMVVVFIILLTELASNLASTAMMVPILAAVATGAGIPPLMLLLPVTVAASCAFMLPAATPPNAIVFGTGHFTIPQMVRAGIGVNIIGAVLTCLFAVFWVPVVFG